MLKYAVLCTLLCYLVVAEPPVQGIKPTNVLGGPEQHASFSFVRPGLTQTSFSFGGPSSHQSFSSSIGNPQLAHRVLPSLAHSLAYRNPGLGFFPIGSAPHGYATSPIAPGLSAAGPAPLPYQAQLDQGAALAYLQQLQQLQQGQVQNYPSGFYQGHQLGQLLALRQAQAQAQVQAQLQQTQPQQFPEQVQLQQENAQQQQQQQQQTQNLLGVAYSSAPSVAHVKVSGNGYKFDF